jgi:uncharacterized damage-inducible protein DinB
MSLSKTLLPEYDQEMATTRRVLERVPEDQLSWQPHEKSMSLGRLATHVAELAGWARTFLQDDSFDIAPPEGSGYQPQNAPSRSALLEMFDKNVASTRAAIEATDDATFMQKWTLLKGGQTIFTLPRVAVLRTMLLNHVIHHRGQLTVYLRLTGTPVPSVYGPTADEGM